MKDYTVIVMADYMIAYDYRLIDIAETFNYSITQVYWALNYSLKHLDFNKYIECRDAMERHKHERWRRKNG